MIKKIQEEVVEYFCDGTGQKTNDVCCKIIFDFGYGSDIDGFQMQLHFGDKVAQEILAMLSDKYPGIDKQRKKILYGL